LGSWIEGETEYQIGFSSTARNGSYFLVGSEYSNYEGGNFEKIELIEESRSNNFNARSDENETKDIDFRIIIGAFAEEGTYLSPVFSAGEKIIWTRMKWDGEFDEDSALKMMLRSGSAPEPGEAWSKWLRYTLTDDESELDISLLPASEFIQFGINFTNDKTMTSPYLSQIEIRYDKFKPTGYITTGEFETANATLFSNFSAIYELNGQVIDFFYSIDSGQTWAEIMPGELKVAFNTNDSARTPVLERMSIDLTEITVESPPDEQKTETGDDETPGIGPLPLTPVTVSSIGISAAVLSMAGLGLGTETGKFAFLKYLLFMVIPLYSKVNHDKVMDNYVRKQIYKYIEEHPGTNYSEIMKDVGVKNGVLVHHLKTLEREEFIKSANDGVYYKRFYPMNVKLPKKEIEGLSWFQIGIFNIIRKTPGVTPKQVAEELGKSKQVINYHLKLMKAAGLIRTEMKGKQRALFATFDEEN
jgi:DNA-binding MarR family transcriptional regulator